MTIEISKYLYKLNYSFPMISSNLLKINLTNLMSLMIINHKFKIINMNVIIINQKLNNLKMKSHNNKKPYNYFNKNITMSAIINNKKLSYLKMN